MTSTCQRKKTAWKRKSQTLSPYLILVINLILAVDRGEPIDGVNQHFCLQDNVNEVDDSTDSMKLIHHVRVRSDILLLKIILNLISISV